MHYDYGVLDNIIVLFHVNIRSMESVMPACKVKPLAWTKND